MLATSIELVKELQSRGFQAYWAGGTVRDFLMGRGPSDYDIVTSAKPDEIEDIVEHTIPVGKKFGVIVAVVNGHNFEIATFRSDAAYTDGRRPDAVYFTNPEEDARRRDFTVNGMFYDPVDKKVLDFVGGQRDLQDKILRFIGDPDERIKEDNLRLMRAIRFKNSLAFSYAPGVLDAIKRNASLINNVSAERLQTELTKILTGPNRGQAFREMADTGLLDYVLPELCEMRGVKQPEIYHHEGDVFEHTMRAIDALPDNPPTEVAWAVLLHDVGKPETFSVSDRIRFNEHANVGGEIVEVVGRRLNFSNTMRANIDWLVRHHMIMGDILKMKRARQAYYFHNPLFPELLEVLRADTLGTEPPDLSLYNKIKDLADQKELLLPMPSVLITGEEIMREFNIPQGPKVGELLDAVHEAQMEEKIHTSEEAKELVRRLLAEDSV